MWGGWLLLFLVYEVAAALRERGTDQRLTLSRNVWRWFDKAFERMALALFLAVLTAHLTLGWPGGLAVILTGAPVALIIAVEIIRRPAALVLLAIPLLLANGPGGCSVELPWPPKPTPSPEPSPTATPSPAPTAEPTPTPGPTPTPAPTATPGPTPTPGSACPRALAEGAEIYLNAKVYGQGLDATLRVRGDLAFCQAIHGTGPNVVADCHLDGMPAPWTTLGCELELLGMSAHKPQACPVWRYRSGGWEGPCSDNQNAQMSCDHFGSSGGGRDDPKTPAFEGEPTVCGEQRDAFGPMAGFFVVAHGLGEVRACRPDWGGCSPWRPVDH